MAGIVYTLHAERMLAEREIAREWVTRAIASPDFTEPDAVSPDAKHAFRRIPENGGRMLRVVYVPDGDSARIITAFFDRRRRK